MEIIKNDYRFDLSIAKRMASETLFEAQMEVRNSISEAINAIDDLPSKEEKLIAIEYAMQQLVLQMKQVNESK